MVFGIYKNFLLNGVSIGKFFLCVNTISEVHHRGNVNQQESVYPQRPHLRQSKRRGLEYLLVTTLCFLFQQEIQTATH
jgi:hypothetical protein